MNYYDLDFGFVMHGIGVCWFVGIGMVFERQRLEAYGIRMTLRSHECAMYILRMRNYFKVRFKRHKSCRGRRDGDGRSLDGRSDPNWVPRIAWRRR